jgi:hypothetical protein
MDPLIGSTRKSMLYHSPPSLIQQLCNFPECDRISRLTFKSTGIQ